MSEEPNVIAFPSKDEPAPSEALTLDLLVKTMESLDQGLKLAAELLAQLDVRVRKLELAQRKADRKNVPVIVNQFGERAN